MQAQEIPQKVRPFLPPRGIALVVLGVVLSAAFVLLARSVVRNDLTAFDEAVIERVRLLDSAATDVVMRFFTYLGSWMGVLASVVLAAVFAAHRRRRALAGLMVAVTLGAGLMNTLVKHGFRRARPELFFEVVPPTSFSFPSGHAMLSAAGFGMIALAVTRLSPHPGVRRTAPALAAFVILMVGLSRIYLGVHWPTDVLAGFAAGTVLLLFGVLALHRVETTGRRRAEVVESTRQSPAWP